MKPWVHAKISAKKFKGRPEDYYDIHDFMDCSKGAFPTNAHRALTHNAWFIKEVLERVKFTNSADPIGNRFPNIINSDGDLVSVRDIGEQHILDDFGNKFIPSAQDYLEHLKYQEWMGNGSGTPSSFKNTKQESTRGKLNPVVYDGSLKQKPTTPDEKLDEIFQKIREQDDAGNGFLPAPNWQGPYKIPENPTPFPKEIRD
jgi:hypothetical protein